MNNTEKYTYELSADECDLSFITVDNAKTLRLERYDPKTPFVLVMNTMATHDPEIDNKLFQFENAKVTIKIEANYL